MAALHRGGVAINTMRGIIYLWRAYLQTPVTLEEKIKKEQSIKKRAVRLKQLENKQKAEKATKKHVGTLSKKWSNHWAVYVCNKKRTFWQLEGSLVIPPLN